MCDLTENEYTVIFFLHNCTRFSAMPGEFVTHCTPNASNISELKIFDAIKNGLKINHRLMLLNLNKFFLNSNRGEEKCWYSELMLM